MKAPDFAYERPEALDGVFELLGHHGDEARILAGGQSLLATLNMRLSSPRLLIDIGGIPGLAGVTEAGGMLRIGAMTRHRDLGASPLVRRHLPLLARAVPHIAHPSIRNRGTIGGSLALADPAAELPACCLALGADMVLASRAGERRVPAGRFFEGLFRTAIAADEVLVAVELAIPPPGSVAGFDELARRHGDYAIVGLAAQGVRGGHGWERLALAFFGVDDRPVLAAGAAAALTGGAGIAAAQAALAGDLDPTGDLNGDPATKKHLARVLIGRVVAGMAG